MAYTLKQLTMAYTAVHDGVAPDAQTTAQLDALLNTGATDKAILSYILNSADDTTALATLSYQFFTGKSPTEEGLAYLIHSVENPNDLNDGYYAKFNIENRYLNFAANLGVYGEGAADFAAKYGAMSFEAFVASVYETIIGSSYAKAAGVDVDAAIAYLIGTKDNLLVLTKDAGMVTDGMTPAQVDLALKAAMAGLIMSASIKEDIGAYAGAANNFMLDLVTGEATYNTDITQTYKPSPGDQSHGTGAAVDGAVDLPGAEPPTPDEPDTPPHQPQPQHITLTTNSDTANGDDLDDTFTGDATTFNAGDKIKGGDGHDTLTLTLTGVSTLAAAQVVDVEAVDIDTTSILDADISGWSGVETLDVTSTRQTHLTAASDVDVTFTGVSLGTDFVVIDGGHDITLNVTQASQGHVGVGTGGRPTGDIVITVDSDYDGQSGLIYAYGGETVTITQTASNAPADHHTNAEVLVYGDVNTSTVSVTSARTAAASGGHGANTADLVTIEDINNGLASTHLGSIHTVDVDGFSILTVRDNALKSLTVDHGDGDILIYNSSSLASLDTTTTLDLSINAQDGGDLTDQGVYETLNIATGDDASTLDLIDFGALTELTLDGKSQLTVLTAIGDLLETVTISGAASLNADLSSATHLVKIDASGSTGDNVLTLSGTTADFVGGSGSDTLELSTPEVDTTIQTGGGDDHVILLDTVTFTGTLDGEAGDADSLEMGADDAALYSTAGNFAQSVFGFETLILRGSSNTLTVDLDELSSTGAFDTVKTEGGGDLTLKGFHTEDTLVLTGAGTLYTVDPAHFFGWDDSFNLVLESHSTLSTMFANQLDVADVETLNITTVDAAGSTATNTISVRGDFETVVISGDQGLDVSLDSTALTEVDASGITSGVFTWTASAVTADLTVTGSATGVNNVDLRDADGTHKYTGGSGDDVIKLTGDHQHTIDLSAGGDDQVWLENATAATATNFVSIEGLGAGDKIEFGGLSFTSDSLGNAATVSQSGSLADAIDTASTLGMNWFVYQGSTYIAPDTDLDLAFDAFVKLVGVYDLSTAETTVGGSTLTL